MKKTLARLLKAYPDKIQEVGDESGSGDGYWLYLSPGWQLDGVHAVHEWNMKDLISAFRCVSQCDCLDCRPLANPNPDDVIVGQGTLAQLRGRK